MDDSEGELLELDTDVPTNQEDTMRRVIMLALLGVAGFAAPAVAQEAAPNQGADTTAQAQTENENAQAPVSMTPEIRQYLDQLESKEAAKLIIWQRAANRAAQRDLRIAVRAWNGVTPSRPTVSPIPFTDSYSSLWPGPYAYPYFNYGYAPNTSYNFSIRNR